MEKKLQGKDLMNVGIYTAGVYSFRYIPGSDAGIHSDFHGADGDYSAADRRHPVHVVSDQGEKTRHDFHHERDHGTSDAVDGHGLLRRLSSASSRTSQRS